MSDIFIIFAGFKFNSEMKKTHISLLYAAACLFLSGCAHTVEESTNEADKRYFDAWLTLNAPGVKPEGLGIYVLEEKEGSGAEVTAEGYALVDYIASDLEGNISSYTGSETAKQLGTYAETSYYGPKFWLTTDGTMQAGILDALKGMKVGGSKEVIIPSWLMSYSTYSTGAEYLAHASSSSSAIYEFTVKDFTKDIDQWQADSIVRFFSNPTVKVAGKPADEVFVKDGAPMTMADTLQAGFFYKQLVAPWDTTTFKNDTTVYINYTGKLLNGLVFDTNIKRVAQDNGLYSPSKTYGPVKITWGEKYSEITMGSENSSVISGFALTLWQMRAMEKGVGVFWSALGYSYSGSGASIPPYSPLIFEIELVAEPED